MLKFVGVQRDGLKIVPTSLGTTKEPASEKLLTKSRR